MSIEKVKAYLNKWNRAADVVELEESTATSQLAAEALGVMLGQIAKSMTLRNAEAGLMVVASGDVRIDNKKFKARFGINPKMLDAEQAFALTGHRVGGICPLALPENCPIYLDESLKRFEAVFPACGSSNSMIKLTIPELEEYSGSLGWVDVCKTAAQKTAEG
ncbi:YbaK/EbsC family protein [Deltaproteobacteria bacterium OttesenSCG-928-K17]|nr:YbaK/EbsC family protein [Deltaproteobacteria bacterium OttesenSCG-928-K17]